MMITVRTPSDEETMASQEEDLVFVGWHTFAKEQGKHRKRSTA